MKAVLIVLFVGSCLTAPVLFLVVYVYCHRLLTFLRRHHPELYEAFGGHGIFRRFNSGLSKNHNAAFFQFMWERDYERYGGELAQRCRTGMTLFWIWAGVFGAGILSMLAMLPYAD